MSKLNRIKLSGTTYELQDLSAQPLLSAGTGIQISGNVISATGGGSGTSTVELTQAEYNALVSGGTVNPDVFYIITDATPIDASSFWTSAQTQSAITEAVSGKADTSAVTAVNNVLTAHTADTTIHVTSSDKTAWSGKQDALVSGTNIKTINNESILGSGNITIQGGGGATYSAGRGIDIDSGNTISFNLPISAGTNNKGIMFCFNNQNNLKDNTLCYGNYNSTNGAVNNSLNLVFGFDNTISLSTSSAYGFIFGMYGRISAQNCFIVGYRVSANNEYENGFGYYNNSNTGSTTADKTLFSVGNGTSTSARHNAFEIRQNGDIYISSGGTDIKLQDHLGSTPSSAITSGDTNAVAGGAVYDKFDEVEQVTARALNNLNDKFGGLKLVQISQSDYNNLQVKDPNTLYVIV